MSLNHNAGWLASLFGLYHPLEYVVYECMYILLHKEKQQLGILNPLAIPFYLTTERYKEQNK